MKTTSLLLAMLWATAAPAETFTLLIYETPAAIKERTAPDLSYWKDFNGYAGAIQAAGILRGGTAFETGDRIKTVSLRGKGASVKVGSHAQSKEVLGGYLVIDVPDLEAALSWAKKAPARDGLSVEVRSSQLNPTMTTAKK